MSFQNNPYKDLLKYLESESEIKKIVKEEKLFTIDTKKEISDNTKLLIKNSLEGIHSDVLQKQRNVPSRGFDVDKFESLMRSKLVDEHKRRQSYERPYISATELFKCLRQTYYARKDYKIDISRQFDFSYLYMINKVGNIVHEIIQELYDHTEIEKTVISKKYGVKGRIDGIRNTIVMEYKTIDESKFTGSYILDHYYQGLIYAYLLNSEYDYKIDTITIVYIMRNLKRIIPFDLPIDDKKAIYFLNFASILKNHLKNNTVPDPINSDEEQCKWCSYKKYCNKENITRNPNKKNNPVFLL